MSCEHTRGLAAELALGIAGGQDRAEALRHLADCPDCRRAVEELSAVADELLVLAPEREPPAGFETRVLARLDTPGTVARGLRRHRAVLWPLASAAAAAAAVAIALVTAYGDDRRVAEHYRATLAQAHGSYFESARLRTPAGTEAGVVFAYRGSPSWLFVVVEPRYRTTTYRGGLTLRSGRRIALPALRIEPDTGGLGQAIPVDLRQVEAVRLAGGRGARLQATLAHGAG